MLLPLIITTFCMIIIGLAIIYFIIATFFGFWCHNYDDIRTSFIIDYLGDNEYWNYLPFVIIIECLLILTMIFIATLIGLWRSHINDLESALFLIFFINAFNLPFYKSFWINKYIKTLTYTRQSKWIMEETTFSQRANKVFCVLMYTLKQASDKQLQQIIMEQKKFSKLNKKQKLRSIEQNFEILLEQDHKNTVLRNILWRLYACCSLIAFISPVGWILWISLKDTIDDLSLLVFTWCMVFCYLFSWLGFVVTMQRDRLWISKDLMDWATNFKQMYHPLVRDDDMHMVKEYYVKIPTIDIVFDYFPKDIALMIVMYLLE